MLCGFRTAAAVAAATVVVQMIQGGIHRVLTTNILCADDIHRQSLERLPPTEWLENILLSV